MFCETKNIFGAGSHASESEPSHNELAVNCETPKIQDTLRKKYNSTLKSSTVTIKEYSDSSNLFSNSTHIMDFAGIATGSFLNLQAWGKERS